MLWDALRNLLKNLASFVNMYKYLKQVLVKSRSVYGLVETSWNAPYTAASTGVVPRSTASNIEWTANNYITPKTE